MTARQRKQGHHHGDLRRVLLRAAQTLLASGDVSSLSMREVARVAGVSSGAPYHHFVDKTDLLAALAEDGFAKLLVQVSKQPLDRTDPRTVLAAVAESYVTFAVRNPVHYRVMFLPEIGDHARFPRLHEVAGRALDALVALLAAGTKRHGDALERAVAVWSTWHGFASLLSAGVFHHKPGMPPIERLRKAMGRRAAIAALSDDLV